MTFLLIKILITFVTTLCYEKILSMFMQKTYGSLNLVCFLAITDVLKYSLLLEYHQYLNDIQAAVYELSDPTNIS